MNKVLIDTGIFVALFNRKDHFHTEAIEFITKKNLLHFTTDSVITEFLYIFHKNIEIQFDFLNLISTSDIIVISFDDSEYSILAKYIKKYKDLPMDYADATIVPGCEKIGTNLIATVDNDFLIYRYNGKIKFENLIKI